jgi:hypothetical protein
VNKGKTKSYKFYSKLYFTLLSHFLGRNFVDLEEHTNQKSEKDERLDDEIVYELR